MLGDKHDDLHSYLHRLYREFGPNKPMGLPAKSPQEPLFTLARDFLGENDLAIIFNTEQCPHGCSFCSLPLKSSPYPVNKLDIISQFRKAVLEHKNLLGIIDRITLANEGSVLDDATFDFVALRNIIESCNALPNLQKIVLESREQYISATICDQLRKSTNKRLDFLIGLESSDPNTRRLLGKPAKLDLFEASVEVISRISADLTVYALYNPNLLFSDDEAYSNARRTIDYAVSVADRHSVPITIRLNPFYVAKGSKFSVATRDRGTSVHKPPKLSEVLQLCNAVREAGVPVYIGLTSEGLAGDMNTYRSREDFSVTLLKRAILNNHTNQASLHLRN